MARFRATHQIALTDASVSARALRRPASQPHLFDVVESANLGTEDMDDDIAGVDQHPVAMRNTFYPRRNPDFVQIFHNPVGD